LFKLIWLTMLLSVEALAIQEPMAAVVAVAL
jgi:hypothetical protein